jgi:hypothetical protein
MRGEFVQGKDLTMTKPNDGGPAFPKKGEMSPITGEFLNAGMSLRDWFAGMALHGLLASGLFTEIEAESEEPWLVTSVNCDQEGNPKGRRYAVLEAAWRLSDAMLKARQE